MGNKKNYSNLMHADFYEESINSNSNIDFNWDNDIETLLDLLETSSAHGDMIERDKDNSFYY